MFLYELKCLAKPKSSYWIIKPSISSRRANVSSRISFVATEIYPRRSHPLPLSIPLLHTFNWQMVPLSHTSLDKCSVSKIWMNRQIRTFSRFFHSHKMHTRIHKHSYSATGNKPWTGLQPSPNLWNNFAATSKRGWEKQQTSSLMKVSGWILKALLNLLQIVGV